MAKTLKSRVLKIRNFKNIGVSLKDNEYQEIYLNGYWNDKIIGNLVILIGENNVGKSNILRAMNIIKVKNIDTNSKSNKELLINSKPNNVQYINSALEIKLMDKEYQYGISFENYNISIINNFPNERINKIIKKIKEDMIRLLDKYISIVNNLERDYDENIFKNSFEKKLNSINLEELKFEQLKKDYERLEGQIKNFRGFCNNNYKDLEDLQQEEDFLDMGEIQLEVEEIQKEFKSGEEMQSNTLMHTKIPSIIYYKRMNLQDNDLTISKEDIDKDNKTNFFTPLFNKIEGVIDDIRTAYAYYNDKTTVINELKKSLYTRIKETFSKEFNMLSSKVFGKHEYDFKIEFDGEYIKLLIERDNESITLSEQSEGFIWFFEFFFQFYFIYDLQVWDIVLIDEPESHLSIPSIRELRNILKEIAKEKGITFITTTHSPFFVDIDYLDEIKIVKKKKEGYGVEIVNFGDIDTHKEADTLKEIIDAFGLGNLNRDIITNPNNKVIFVEGITDYNYLIAFKKLYEYKNNGENLNLSFLPIAGLGKMHENHNEELKNKIKLLSKLNNVVVLTDGGGTANIFKELSLSEEKLNVIKLTDIDNNFEKIESLFSESDKENFESIIKNKSLEASSLFKNIILDLDKELDEETINNFNKVLLYLKNEKTL